MEENPEESRSILSSFIEESDLENSSEQKFFRLDRREAPIGEESTEKYLREGLIWRESVGEDYEIYTFTERDRFLLENSEQLRNEIELLDSIEGMTEQEAQLMRRADDTVDQDYEGAY